MRKKKKKKKKVEKEETEDANASSSTTHANIQDEQQQEDEDATESNATTKTDKGTSNSTSRRRYDWGNPDDTATADGMILRKGGRNEEDEPYDHESCSDSSQGSNLDRGDDEEDDDRSIRERNERRRNDRRNFRRRSSSGSFLSHEDGFDRDVRDDKAAATDTTVTRSRSDGITSSLTSGSRSQINGSRSTNTISDDERDRNHNHNLHLLRRRSERDDYTSGDADDLRSKHTANGTIDSEGGGAQDASIVALAGGSTNSIMSGQKRYILQIYPIYTYI